jgi:hypothetical protein
MTEKESASFLEQIDEAKRAVAAWPQWLQESTSFVTAAVPAALAAKAAPAAKESAPVSTTTYSPGV